MEIKRKVEFFSATSRRIVVRRQTLDQRVMCMACGNAMLTAEETAGMFGISQRSIFQFVEAGSVHFTEIENGVLMICFRSLTEALDKKSEKYL